MSLAFGFRPSRVSPCPSCAPSWRCGEVTCGPRTRVVGWRFARPVVVQMVIHPVHEALVLQPTPGRCRPPKHREMDGSLFRWYLPSSNNYIPSSSNYIETSVCLAPSADGQPGPQGAGSGEAGAAGRLPRRHRAVRHGRPALCAGLLHDAGECHVRSEQCHMARHMWYFQPCMQAPQCQALSSGHGCWRQGRHTIVTCCTTALPCTGRRASTSTWPFRMWSCTSTHLQILLPGAVTPVTLCAGGRHQPGHPQGGRISALVQQAVECHQVCAAQPGRRLCTLPLARRRRYSGAHCGGPPCSTHGRSSCRSVQRCSRRQSGIAISRSLCAAHQKPESRLEIIS